MSLVGQGGVKLIAAGKRNNNKSENSFSAYFRGCLRLCKYDRMRPEIVLLRRVRSKMLSGAKVKSG